MLEFLNQSVNEYELFYFDSFDIYINEIKTTSTIKKEIYKMSLKIARTYTFIFNIEKFVDYKLFFLKTRYNVAWFKQKSREVFKLIKWLYQRKIYGRKNIFLNIGSFIKRGFIFICIYTVILILLYITLVNVIKTLYMFWELAPLLWNLIKK